MLDNTIGEVNAAVGFGALGSNTSGIENTAVGISALANNTDRQRQHGHRRACAEENIDGDINIALGRNAGLNVSTASNVICIGGPRCECDRQLLH